MNIKIDFNIIINFLINFYYRAFASILLRNIYHHNRNEDKLAIQQWQIRTCKVLTVLQSFNYFCKSHNIFILLVND